MKKLFSMILAVAMVATLALSAAAETATAAGKYVFDSSDSEYWAADLNMLDKTGAAFWTEDGVAYGYNDPSYTDATGVVLLDAIPHGWYEVILCNLGRTPEWYPADVKGKIALCIRGDSTFTEKVVGAKDAGAIACLVGNNARDAEGWSESSLDGGTYENVSMSVEYYVLPQGSLSSDAAVDLIAKTAGVSIEEAVAASRAAFGGQLELGLDHKTGTWLYFGTEEEYKANTTRTDANTITGSDVTVESITGASAGATATATEAAPAAATYAVAASGSEVPADSVFIAGEIIGSELGWDGTEASGRTAAFDGNTASFFDPATASVDYCGVDAGEEMILTKIVICPRDGQLPRFNGATIEASNDPEFEDSVELFYSDVEATEFAYVECEIDESVNTGYRYFRYINYMSHGDVAEVEFYGKAKDGSNPTYGAAATTEAPAAEATETATSTASIEVVEQEYPNMEVIADPGAGFATLEEATASIGKTAISGYAYVAGTNGNANEGPENLWDNDTATKFCTGEFPTISIVELDGEYAIDGIIMATANDNSSYNNRSPYEWVIYGSNDGSAWTALAYGDDYFFEETDFTYYAAPLTTEGTYKYIQFQSAGALSGCFQVSELVLTGMKVEAAPVVEEEPAVEEPVVEEVVEEEPVVEEAVVEEAVVEEPAEEAVEEAVVEEVVEEAAQTFDFGVIAAVVAILSAAGYAISKKR